MCAQIARLNSSLSVLACKVRGMTTQLRYQGPPSKHEDVARTAVPDGIALWHLPVGRALVSVPLDHADQVAFELSQPARRIPGYRGQRNMPGWWWSSSTGGHVVYQSWLERHHLMELDRVRQVVGISGQPFVLSWTAGLRRHKHVPDFFVRFTDGRGAVVDCRPVDRADAEFHRVAAITKAICRQLGWDYRLAGEPDPVRAANLTWLAGYRRPYVPNTEMTEALIELATVPVPLLQAARAVGDPMAVLPSLFHLLWAGELACDLQQPLSDHALVWTDHG